MLHVGLLEGLLVTVFVGVWLTLLLAVPSKANRDQVPHSHKKRKTKITPQESANPPFHAKQSSQQTKHNALPLLILHQNLS